MKKNFLWIFILGITMAFSSCEQYNAEPTISEADLAEFALLAVSSSSDMVASSSTTGAGITKTSAAFSGKNNLTEVSTNSLPTTIKSYVSTNAAGATIERAGKTNTGAYIVYLTQADGTSSALAFTATGTYVGTSTGKGTDVAIANLPSTVTSYVAANYAGATITKAVMDAEGNYLLAVKKADGTFVGVAFTSAGVFVQEISIKNKFGCGPKNTTTTTSTPN